MSARFSSAGSTSPWASTCGASGGGTAVYDLVVGILFILFYRRPLDLDKVENEEDPTGTKKASISRALKSPMLWALALIFLFDEAAFMAINGFIVQYLTTQLDASLVLANAIFSLFGLMGALTPPISGWITQKWNNHRWVLLVGLFVAVIYTALVFQLKDPMLYYPLSILAGIVGGAVPSILWQFTPNTVEDADIPAANAFMAFTQNIGMSHRRAHHRQRDRHVGLEQGSLLGMVPLYIICLIIYFAFGVPEEAQALVCFACDGVRRLGRPPHSRVLCPLCNWNGIRDRSCKSPAHGLVYNRHQPWSTRGFRRGDHDFRTHVRFSTCVSEP